MFCLLESIKNGIVFLFLLFLFYETLSNDEPLENHTLKQHSDRIIKVWIPYMHWTARLLFNNIITRIHLLLSTIF